MRSPVGMLIALLFLVASCRPTGGPVAAAWSAAMPIVALDTEVVDMANLTSQGTLRERAHARGIAIGAAVDALALQTDPEYRRILSREFSMVTPENAVKFGPLRPQRERYDFQAADAIVAFAEAQRMGVRGHTLVWHNQLPQWLTQGAFTHDELLQILHEHIDTVVGRYRGRVAAWDVVNEALGDDGSLRDTFWLRGIGPEYLDLAFQWAHEADPSARLFLNDYGAEGLGPKSDGIYRVVEGLLSRGVPIHGVGLQMHITTDGNPPPATVAANMQRLGELGLEVQITEMDVRLRLPAGHDTLARQAAVYHDVLSTCLEAPNCTAFVLWGFADGHSWIPSHFQGWGEALIFDQAYRPKPAYEALQSALAGR